MLQPGRYRARAVEGALGETKTGKPQVAVRFELLDLAGEQITWHGYFTEKTTDTTLRALRTCGWRGDMLDDLSGIESNEVSLVLEIQPDDQGQPRPQVRWVNAAGGLALHSPLSADAARTFAARMRAEVVLFDKRSKAPRPPADDEAPF